MASTCSATTSTRNASPRGSERVATLGPVLGAYHPVHAYNVRRLREISGLDEVSFHMSGTEAVMQAVRLARYHTGRSRPGALLRRLPRLVGRRAAGRRQSAARARDLHAARTWTNATLRVLRTRRDIACVLVNPLQALHPNAGAPGDSSLVDSGRRAAFDRAAYTEWLRAAARGLHRARHRADLRRGLRRLPAGAAAGRRNTSACAPIW